jgi:nucleotide-binding universal stress UspA family protein
MSDSTLQTILVGLDVSPDCVAAVELSLGWARATGARLMGVGIIDEPAIRRGEPVPLGAGHYKHERDEARLADARLRVDRFLQDFADRCAGEGIRCGVVTKVGVPHEQIVLAAQRVDLVVLPRRSHFHFETERKERDDTVERVLQQCPRPVVTVPTGPRGSGPVVVAYDGGIHAARALHAFALAGIEPGSDVLIVSLDEDESEAAERAQSAIALLASHGVPAHRAMVPARMPVARAILHVVEATHARLLVAGSRSNRRLTHLLSGSVTRVLLEEGQAPLLLSG